MERGATGRTRRCKPVAFNNVAFKNDPTAPQQLESQTNRRKWIGCPDTGGQGVSVCASAAPCASSHLLVPVRAECPREEGSEPVQALLLMVGPAHPDPHHTASRGCRRRIPCCSRRRFPAAAACRNARKAGSWCLFENTQRPGGAPTTGPAGRPAHGSPKARGRARLT